MTKQYPEIIDSDELRRQAHIPDEEIERDKTDTLSELESLRQCVKAFGVLARNHLDDNQRKLFHFHQQSCLDGIASREKFVRYLSLLQEARKS